MRVIKVTRYAIPADWTEEHCEMLQNGHERGVVTTTKGREKIANDVLKYASTRGVGVNVFGGLTFVDVSGKNGNGPVRFEVVD